MSVCKNCRNYNICTLDVKDRIYCCSFAYPKEENHDKEIRNKAIDEFAERLKEIIYEKAEEFRDIRFLTVEAVDILSFKIAEQMKGE